MTCDAEMSPIKGFTIVACYNIVEIQFAGVACSLIFRRKDCEAKHETQSASKFSDVVLALKSDVPSSTGN